MPVLCYKKLWKLLIDRDIKKSELCNLAGISQSTIAKLSKNQNVTTEALAKICAALNCNLDDIADISCDTAISEVHNV